MTAYENGLKSSDTRFLLRPDSDFFRFFSSPSGKPAAASRHRHAAAAGGAEAVGRADGRTGGRSGHASRLYKVKTNQTGGSSPMRSIAFADFLIGVGILFVLEGLMFAASPAWMRRAMKSALATPDNILRGVGIGSAVAGLILIWVVRTAGVIRRVTRTRIRSPVRFATRGLCCHVRNDGRGTGPASSWFTAIVRFRVRFCRIRRRYGQKCPAQMLAPSPRSGALWTSNSARFLRRES